MLLKLWKCRNDNSFIKNRKTKSLQAHLSKCGWMVTSCSSTNQIESIESFMPNLPNSIGYSTKNQESRFGQWHWRKSQLSQFTTKSTPTAGDTQLAFLIWVIVSQYLTRLDLYILMGTSYSSYYKTGQDRTGLDKTGHDRANNCNKWFTVNIAKNPDWPESNQFTSGVKIWTRD